MFLNKAKLDSNFAKSKNCRIFIKTEIQTKMNLFKLNVILRVYQKYDNWVADWIAMHSCIIIQSGSRWSLRAVADENVLMFKLEKWSPVRQLGCLLQCIFRVYQKYDN